MSAIVDPYATRDDLRLWMSEAREAYLRAALRERRVEKVSACGLRCADLLVEFLGGMHHFPGGDRKVRATRWDDFFVVVKLAGSPNLATTDGDALTRLVFLAHDLGIRVDVSPCNMQYVELMLHPRVRERAPGGIVKHPTLDAAVAAWRAHNPLYVPPVRVDGATTTEGSAT